MRVRLGLIVIFLLGLAMAWWSFWPGTGSEFVEVTVVEGDTARKVANTLVSNGLLKSRVPYLIWTKARRSDARIKIGRYRFSKGRSAYWIVDDLIKGRTLKVRFTLPEGHSSWQIAERLESMGVATASSFLKVVKEKNLEGYLFPATYEFDYGLDPTAIAKIMADEFNRRWTPDLETRAQDLGLSRHQVVTLASIAEREIRRRDELPMVVAVYHNRLKKDMTLDADPTVQFAMGFWKQRLTYEDYRKTISPYNTYLNKGLPPGPICSPGLDAVNAALYPAQTAALFMVAQDDGYHNFSVTYKDHVNKVNARNRENRQRKMLERKP